LGLKNEEEQGLCAMQNYLRLLWHTTKFYEQRFKSWTPLKTLDDPKELQDVLQTAFLLNGN
jgi:hypothetical protein